MKNCGQIEVNPLTIDRMLFQQERKDKLQEKTRRLIIKAFSEMDNNPQRAGWVEQALELAQRIANGESWETICNQPNAVVLSTKSLF